MNNGGLCKLPPAPPGGCCEEPPALPAAPIPIDNPPGLSSISYRIGTFTSFRRAMLDEIANIELLGTTPNPWTGWHEGTDSDYQTIFIELWAYLADILTFYQERIANEAYIGTATQRDSLTRLAQLIGYRPGPGAGASGLVAFTVAKGKVVTIPAGHRVGSRAQPGKPAAVFETSAAVTARAEHSVIAASAIAPTNQFAQISSFAAIFGAFGELTPAMAEDVYGSAGLTYLKTLPLLSSAAVEAFRLGALDPLPLRASEAAVTMRLRPAASSPLHNAARAGSIAASPTRARALTAANVAFVRPSFAGIRYRPFVSQTTRTIVLQGVNNKFTVGDDVLIVENEFTRAENATPHRVSSAAVDKTTNTTTITWQETAGTTYDNSSRPVALYALRVKAGAFGNSAPNWWTLSATLTNSDGKHGGASPPPPFTPYPDNWDDINSPPAYLPRQSIRNLVALDAVYNSAAATADNPGWVVLCSGDRSISKPYRFVDAQSVTLTDYALNAKVTQLFLAPAVVPASKFGIRDTVILTGAETLRLENNLPVPDPLQGDTLILAGLYPHLQDGQAIIVKGNLFTPSDEASMPVPAAEVRLIDGPPQLDAADNLTTIKFKQPLANQYIRSTTTMLANVVAITQGEAVKDEVLGSGDGSALQSYALKKNPLTYLPSIDPDGASPVKSTLLLSVNGLRWSERPTLAESGPDAQEFTTRRDDREQITVVFGDGVNGARPPTGTDNVRARYRRGLGNSGNVQVDGVQQLIDNLAGVQQVTNPQPTSGGTDAERPDQIRLNAPTSMHTFNRAVSPGDYAALALTFPGIAKGSAAWIVRDANGNTLAQPYIQLTVATVDESSILQTSIAGQLRNFLDVRRDPNVPLRIQDFRPVYIDVAVSVDLDDGYPRQGTFGRVRAALGPGVNLDGTFGYFAFQNLDFGESLHLSAIYAIIMGVPGVRDANITTFRRMDLDAGAPSTVRTDILIGPTEIAVIGNDPTHPELGLIVINQGSGGFVES